MPACAQLNITPRTLLGPGPSNVHPRVLQALAYPPVGHLDPQFLALMDEIQVLLRYVFETENELTLALPGTGTAGMEAALANFIQPGDHALIGVNGYFSERMCDMAGRYGATVHRLEKAWGQVFSLEEIESALKKQRAQMVCLVQAETSTGALQPLNGIGDLVHEYGGLLVVDCVTSLGGLSVSVDALGIDIAYSCTQKCIGSLPGLAPITISARACDALKRRRTIVANWYLDLTLLSQYWGQARTYHHTAPINSNYALREALRLMQEEGREARFARHQANAELLWTGLEDLNLEFFVPLPHRLPMLTTVRVPERVDEAAIRRALLEEYNVEIGGGLGELKGKVWRIGLMGYSSSRENIALLLAALRELLRR
ncbi:MAG: alanine--glyoxylate aminotransferase family protein [candidate division NC10 bacterium]|nr:alanine--glyoxylate aminotransferase family protein [candidate division NC10 bacterium]